MGKGLSDELSCTGRTPESLALMNSANSTGLNA